MKSIVFAAGLVGLVASSAAAAPGSGLTGAVSDDSLVQQVQGYHRDCNWVGGGWHYRHHGKLLVCRPHKPHGHGWVWHSEGPRHGWYHQQRKHWHHKHW